jgi:beta-galactosidase
VTRSAHALPHLDLEAGINRVALRATLEPGRGVLRARADGLKSAGIEFESTPPPSPVFAASPSVERFQPEAVLPVSAPDWQTVPALARPQPPLVRTASVDEKMAGRYTKTFSYSAPGSQITHLDTDAQPGKNAYADTDSPFGELPAILRGADWIKACNSDALYNAVDLVELAVDAGAVVVIAHDDRLPRPPWLADQFEQTPDKIAALGNPMTLFVRRMPDGGSLTAGANTEAGAPTEANMYVVFVAAAK